VPDESAGMSGAFRLMNKALSVYLNALRALAAVVVVLSHVSQGRLASFPFSVFHTWELGHDAVVIFFVLSGYVVGFSANHGKTARGYVVARLSRMLSCLVPLLIVAPVLYYIGRSIDPVLYRDPTAFMSPENLRTFLETITFTQEYEMQSVVYFGVAPLWSLSYEVAYYILFGLLVYLRGSQRTITVALALFIMGPKIILLAPLWFAGWYISTPRRGLEVPGRWAFFILIATVLSYPLYVAGHMYFSPRFFYRIYQLGINQLVLNQSHFFLTDYVLGVIVCLHILAARVYLKDSFEWPRGFVLSVNWLADRSFAVYIFHFPLLYLAAAVLGEQRHGFTGGMAMLVFSLSGSAALSHISDLRKREWRIIVDRLTRLPRYLWLRHRQAG
jgi:peptidoglycan/LPS O-acetylase OafA/YrhL